MARIKLIVRFVVILVCVSSIWTAWKAGESPIEVTYIANEGVLIITSSHKVLIDALFDNPNPNYRPPSKDMLERMQSGSFQPYLCRTVHGK